MGRPTGHSNSPSAEPRQLVVVMQQLLSKAIAPATRAAYRRASSLLVRFTNRAFPGIVAFPTSTALLASFIASLFEEGYAASTITTYSASLSAIHKFADWPDPAKSFLVKKLIAGAEKCRGKQDRRLPITLAILRKILHILPSITATGYEQKLFAAMFLLAFYAFLRVGEITTHSRSEPGLHVLQLANVKFRQRGQQLVSMELTIESWKAKGSAPPCSINIACSQSHKECPVRAVAAYVTARGAQAGPLFVSRAGLPITRNNFSLILKRSLQAAGITHHYTSHSFRIGAATNASLLGIPENELQRLGRWKSDAYKKYIRINTFQLNGLGHKSDKI